MVTEMAVEVVGGAVPKVVVEMVGDMVGGAVPEMVSTAVAEREPR